jgi:4,5:9,10-diseco-3-hydroxy-5,9,17-trioxoandrosta-1(10),2-diene-4-oate hydrolase
MNVHENATGRFSTIDGRKLYYHDVGQGPVLLCIHGGAPGATGWGNFGRNAAELSQHFRLLIVDLPGYGRSEIPDGDSDRNTAYARMMAGLLSALSIKRAHVLGMATGGAVAMIMAIDHPATVDRLILVSTAGSRSMFGLKPLQAASNTYLAGEGPTREKMRAYLDQLIHNKALITDDVIEERYQASIDPEFLDNVARGRAGKGSTVRELWKSADQISCRTLIVWGRENRAHSFESGVLLHSLIPDSQLHVFGNCGLWVPFEKQHEFNRLALSFLTSP